MMICLLTFITMLSLTSCQVNWFDQHYDVPWWVIAVPAVLFLLIVLIAAGKCISKKEYVCPKCNQTFHPKWWKAAVSVHIGDDRVFKCPHCGRAGLCNVSHSSKYQ